MITPGVEELKDDISRCLRGSAHLLPRGQPGFCSQHSISPLLSAAAPVLKFDLSVNTDIRSQSRTQNKHFLFVTPTCLQNNGATRRIAKEREKKTKKTADTVAVTLLTGSTDELSSLTACACQCLVGPWVTRGELCPRGYKYILRQSGSSISNVLSAARLSFIFKPNS